ncbi:hypothetical protein LZ31DRAFT_77158 [Colletotrichum somersetense]|nr:hypothetical protein LZ31DRAFT_77158 [Colletotrichum somersetense]
MVGRPGAYTRYLFPAVIWGILIWGTQLTALHSHICIHMHIDGLSIRGPPFGHRSLPLLSQSLSPRSVVASYRAPWGAESRDGWDWSLSFSLYPPPWRTFLKDSFSHIHFCSSPSLFSLRCLSGLADCVLTLIPGQSLRCI